MERTSFSAFSLDSVLILLAPNLATLSATPTLSTGGESTICRILFMLSLLTAGKLRQLEVLCHHCSDCGGAVNDRNESIAFLRQPSGDELTQLFHFTFSSKL